MTQDGRARDLRAGLDIGGTKAFGVLVDAEGEVLANAEIPTLPGNEGVLETASSIVMQLASEAGRPVGAFESIGIGIPGIVRPGSGSVEHALNLGIRDLALADRLRKRLRIPVAVENDVNVAALGAYHRLSRKPASLAYLNLGTGVAASFVVNGDVWRGAHGSVGEIGHISIDPAGPACTCGQRGCLEVVASGAAIGRLWPPAQGNVARLLEAVVRGDLEAHAAWATYCRDVVAALRILTLTLDPERIVIGGGVASGGAALLAGLRTAIDASAADSVLLAALDIGSRLVVAHAGPSDAAFGATLLVPAPLPAAWERT